MHINHIVMYRIIFLSPKVLQWINEAETKAKQEQDEAAQQRLMLSHALALVQAKSYKAFKRDIKANGLTPIHQITFEFLRANLEFVKGNARKAIKLLGMGIQQIHSGPQLEPAWINYINSLYQNNLSCLHLMLKKPNLGVYYVNQAYEVHLQTLKQMPTAMPHFLLKIKKDEIIYNTGMNLLHAGQPALAFQSFLSA